MRFTSHLLLIPLLLAAACGGDSSSTATGTTDRALIVTDAVPSSIIGITYPLDIYLPAGYGGNTGGFPVMFVLDGEVRFPMMVEIVNQTALKVMIVGIRNVGRRNRDFMPVGPCTPDGGGNDLYYRFLTTELIPFIDENYKSDGVNRTLVGHSHGGTFAFYAMFSERSGARNFTGYVSVDASVGCAQALLDSLEQVAADSTTDGMPIALHVSATREGNLGVVFPFVDKIIARSYPALELRRVELQGSHTGIVFPAFVDAVGFLYAN